MKLYLNKTSPYARLVRVVALEKGLEDSLELCWVDPWTDDERLLRINPASRIPVLITDQGESIAESLLIAVFLDSLADSPALLPRSHLASAMHLTGIAQGLMDAAFNTVIARKYQGPAQDDSPLGQRHLCAIDRCLCALEAWAEENPQSPFTLGEISTAVALDYLNFRLPESGWQTRMPQLARRQAQWLQRSALQRTAFS